MAGTSPAMTKEEKMARLQAAHDLSKAEKAHSYKKIVPRKAA